MHTVELIATFELFCYNKETKRTILSTKVELPFVPFSGLVIELPGEFEITLSDLKWSTQDRCFRSETVYSYPSVAALQHFNKRAFVPRQESEHILLYTDAETDYRIEIEHYQSHGWRELTP